MKKEVENWWKQAKDDLEKAQILLNNKKYDGATFFCQQAIEKGLKAVDILKNKKLIKTHDVVLLARRVDTPAEIVELCKKINPVYTFTRYPDGEEAPIAFFDYEKAKDIYNKAEEVFKWIKEKLSI